MRKFASHRFEVESAGLEPGTINPLVAEVLKEEEIDITNKKTNSVLEFYREGRRYSYVITVCSKEASEQYPVFPGVGLIQRLHWLLDDLLKVIGIREERSSFPFIILAAPISVHMLRNTRLTHLPDADVPIAVVSRYLGTVRRVLFNMKTILDWMDDKAIKPL